MATSLGKVVENTTQTSTSRHRAFVVAMAAISPGLLRPSSCPNRFKRPWSPPIAQLSWLCSHSLRHWKRYSSLSRTRCWFGGYAIAAAIHQDQFSTSHYAGSRPAVRCLRLRHHPHYSFGACGEFFHQSIPCLQRPFINEGCSLIPSTERLPSHAGFYWILMTVRWIST